MSAHQANTSQMNGKGRSTDWDLVLIIIGLCLLATDVAFFIILLVDLVNIGTLNLPEDVSPHDELYVLMLCTAHFPSNTVSLCELIGRLFRRRSQKLEERDFEESNFSPTWFLVSVFACMYDSTGLVRTRLSTYTSLICAATFIAVTTSLATALWSGITTLYFFILYKRKSEFVARAMAAMAATRTDPPPLKVQHRAHSRSDTRWNDYT